MSNSSSGNRRAALEQGSKPRVRLHLQQFVQVLVLGALVMLPTSERDQGVLLGRLIARHVEDFPHRELGGVALGVRDKSLGVDGEVEPVSSLGWAVTVRSHVFLSLHDDAFLGLSVSAVANGRT